MSRWTRLAIGGLLIVWLAGCTLVSTPEPRQYGPTSVWRDRSVALEGFHDFSWKPSTDKGLEPNSMPMAPDVARSLRDAIVENLASCYRLGSSGPVGFWVAFRLTAPRTERQASTSNPRLVLSVVLPGADHPAWTSEIEAPSGFATSGGPTKAIVHDLLLEFPDGNPRSCR